MKIKRAFIKGTNWALAGLIGLLGFTNCEDQVGREEYGTPSADFTVKGTVVDKATGKPIKGIRVGYSSLGPYLMYGPLPAPYRMASVTTDAKGEYKLTEQSVGWDDNTPVYVNDIDGPENGLYRDTVLNVSFKNAAQTDKPKGWYSGEFTVNVDVKLTEQKTDE